MENRNLNDDRRWPFVSDEKCILPNTWAEGEGNGPSNILKEILLELEKEPDTGSPKVKADMISKLREVEIVLSAIQKKGHARFRRSPNDKELWKVENLPLSLCIEGTNHQPPRQSSYPPKTSRHTAAHKVENLSSSFRQPYSSGYSSYQESSSQHLAIDPHMYNQASGGCSDASGGPYASSTQAIPLELSLSSVSNHSSGVCTEAPASPYARVVPSHLDLMYRDSLIGSIDAPTGTGPSSTQIVPIRLVHRFNGRFIPPSDETLNLLLNRSTPSSQVCVKVPPVPATICGIRSGKGRRQRLRAAGQQNQVTATRHGRRSYRIKKREQRTGLNTILVSAVSGRLSDIPPDDYAWRKYGQKPIRDSSYPRSYYRCSITTGCLARKQVERSTMDPTKLLVTYKGEHTNCSVTVAKAPPTSSYLA